MTTYKVWDAATAIYEGSDREEALAAWESISEHRRNDRALCQVDVDGENKTSEFLRGCSE